ncbi:5'-methylthioadenosine phosphorylase [hydrothermal vent metagenome]|uniref:5'-methylthioadenosine phosphorylase n=1 Tax=hydrothermal vent metagenome TaxID=652676 RepID=A0A3B0YHL8_9ZZZZ
MTKLAVIGGSGLVQLEGMNIIRRERVETPYGEPSSSLVHGELEGVALVFLPRHGDEHTIPPHKVNYRANIFALQQAGVEDVIAIAAVGGIHEDMVPGVIAIPDQIIDYTWGRKHTFFEDEQNPVTHIDFTRPYSERLRKALRTAASKTGLDIINGGTYGATHGPRLETAAEIQRMQRDGCTMVGMTGMPEAALACELELSYACCAVSANRAAGLSPGGISMADIQSTLATAMENIKRLLSAL